MAIREVCKIDKDEDILRKVSKPVKDFDKKLGELIDDMWDTMYANNGMGFAAPQVGVLRRVIVMDVNNMKFELVNPEITYTEGSDVDQEGCLSCGKVKGKVRRPMIVTVKAQDRFGYDITITGEKLLARCICHEVDHLNGIVFLDKVIKE